MQHVIQPGHVIEPDPVIHAHAKAYMTEAGLPLDESPMRYMPAGEHPGRGIAKHYEQARHDPNDPDVKRAYDAFKRETLAQFNHLRQHGYKFEPMPSGEEAYYGDPVATLHDLKHNNHLYFFTGGTPLLPGHPLAEPTDIVINGHRLDYNQAFRAVHDVFGHAHYGTHFGPSGEEQAYRSHARIYSPAARPAMAQETKGQNSWMHFLPGHEHMTRDERPFAEQKANILRLSLWTPYTGAKGGQGWHNEATGEIRYQEEMPHEIHEKLDGPAPDTHDPTERKLRHTLSLIVEDSLKKSGNVGSLHGTTYGYSPETAQKYKQAASAVLARMPTAALARFKEHTTGIHFAWTVPQIAEYVKEKDGEDIEGAGGVYRPSAGEVVVDGDFPLDTNERLGTTATEGTAGVYAHEFSHAVDGPRHELSSTGEWKDAWHDEVWINRHNYFITLSGYARQSCQEGWAEFGRLLYGSAISPALVEKRFPQCSRFWRAKGLWPVDDRPALGFTMSLGDEDSQMLPDIFSESRDLPNGTHVDIFKSTR